MHEFGGLYGMRKKIVDAQAHEVGRDIKSRVLVETDNTGCA